MIVTRCKTWLPGIVALLLFTTLCCLGIWQLQRAAEKQHMIERFESRRGMPTQNISSLLKTPGDINDYRLHLHGNFLNGQDFLLDNRIVESRSGYNVITPFLTEGKILLVDRGWLPAHQDKQRQPGIPSSDRVQISGSTYLPAKNPFTLKPDDYEHTSFPIVVQTLDLQKMARRLDTPVLPFLLRQSGSETLPLHRDVPTRQLDPHKNHAYAVQWFALAIAVFLLSIRHFGAREKNHPITPNREVP